MPAYPQDPSQYLNRVGPAVPTVGRIFLFNYRYWQNDQTPLSLMLAYEPMYTTFLGVNLNYLAPQMRRYLFRSWKKFHIAENDIWYIGYNQIKMTLPIPSVCIRRYKTHGIYNCQRVASDHDMIEKSIGMINPGVRQQLWLKTQQEIGSLMAVEEEFEDKEK